ncbi:MAG: membrane protein of unknown function [Promethearchaeota archaeon]|nr:MAG: membrane protein of unknown function [Candidatus Lokiarchaeota archaeon]
MTQEQDYKTYFKVKQKGGNGFFWIFLVFIAIFLLIVIYLPFYVQDLKFKFGNLFTFIFNFAGTICLILGFGFLIVGIVVFFKGSFKGVKYLIYAMIFLLMGAYLTGTMFSIFGNEIGNEATGGYH